jgi:hypothetical protein
MTPAYKVQVIYAFPKGGGLDDPLLYENGVLVGISYGHAGNGSLFALTQSAKGVWSKSTWHKFVRSSGGPSGASGSLILGPKGDL